MKPVAALLICLTLLAACAPRREAPPEAGVPSTAGTAPAEAVAPDDCDDLYTLYEVCYGGGVGRTEAHCAGLAEDIATDRTLPETEARAVGGFCGAACLAGAGRYGLMPFPVFAAEYCGA